MLQLPTAMAVTVLLLTVQTDGVVEANCTARFEVAVALAMVLLPTVRVAGVKAIAPMVCAGLLLVTVIVELLMVTPSWAVTSTVIVLLPTARLMLPEAEPLVTAVPLTFTVAVLSVTVGVTVSEVTLLATLTE